MPTVSQREDIKSLIERVAGIRVVGEATVRGVKEYHSNCPFCGGHDRFITRPETGQFTCATRGCGKSGDAIDFLVWYCEMERWQAMQELGLEHVSFYDAPKPKTRSKLGPPPEKWQETANVFVERAVRYLWGSSPKAQETLAYLRSRGLTDDTIRRKRYGYCPLAATGRWYGIDPSEGALEHWGLKPEDVNEKIAERGTIAIPHGIIIPWYEKDVLWKIAVKRYDQPKPHDYGEVAGSRYGLYNVDSIRPETPCMIVEGEIDVASVEQAVDGLISIIGTGSADKGRNPRFRLKLLEASYLIQSFDNDEPGRDKAVWWLCHYDYCFRHEPLGAKDPNDMLRAHGSALVRDWVQAGLDKWEGYRQSGIVPESLARVS